MARTEAAMLDRYLVISADCHAGPPQPGYRSYFEKRHLADFDAYCARRRDPQAARAAVQGDQGALAGILDAFLGAVGATPEMARTYSSISRRLCAAVFDSKLRDACLDEEGIAGEVIYPDGFLDNQPPFSDPMESAAGVIVGTRSYPFELRAAGARAYNRWLADFCAQSPQRRAGVAFLPPAHDPGAIVEELRAASRAGLRGGFLIPPLDEGLPGYHDPHYEPIWRAAEELELPVACHGGMARAPDGARVYGREAPLATVLHFTESAFLDRRPLWFFLWGGVFERHPGLRLVFAEQLAHWVPQELRRLDEMYDMFNLGALRARLSMRPREYWNRHCYVAATFLSRAEAEMRAQMGEGRVLWGSDFPHPEGTWPYTPTCLRQTFHGIPAHEVAALLGGSALALYGFDEAKLRALADRIGPLAADLARAPERLPADYLGMGLR
jgi:predicted TIM-barrel fold metal-dependent hydrolase